MNNDDMKFIGSLFYIHIKYKDQYFINYISDDNFKIYYERYSEEMNDTSIPNIQDRLQKSINTFIKCSPDSIEANYSAIFACLMAMDQYYYLKPPTTEHQLCLTIEELKKSLLFLEESSLKDQLYYFLNHEEVNMQLYCIARLKCWPDRKVTLENSPFNFLRGILLTGTEATVLSTTSLLSKPLLFFSPDKKLNVVTCHRELDFRFQCTFTRKLSFNNYGVSVQVNDSEKDQEVINECLNEVKAAQATILVFPELSLSKSMKDKLLKQLKEDTALQSLKLVVLGSNYMSPYSVAPTTIPKSISEIYFRDPSNSQEWIEVTYSKKIPSTVPYNTKIIVNPNDPNLDGSDASLMIEDFISDCDITLIQGADMIMGVAICRDAMDLLSPHNPIHKYCDMVDMMIIISGNNGDSNMFVGVAECLGRWHNCATVYANLLSEANYSTNSIPNFDPYLEISFGIFPYKDYKSSTAVSGTLTYAAKHSIPDSVSTLASSTDSFTILHSSGITYEVLDPTIPPLYCKSYQILLPK